MATLPNKYPLPILWLGVIKWQDLCYFPLLHVLRINTQPNVNPINNNSQFARNTNIFGIHPNHRASSNTAWIMIMWQNALSINVSSRYLMYCYGLISFFFLIQIQTLGFWISQVTGYNVYIWYMDDTFRDKAFCHMIRRYCYLPCVKGRAPNLHYCAELTSVDSYQWFIWSTDQQAQYRASLCIR